MNELVKYIIYVMKIDCEAVINVPLFDRALEIIIVVPPFLFHFLTSMTRTDV